MLMPLQISNGEHGQEPRLCCFVTVTKTSELDKVVNKYVKVQREANDKFQIQSIEWIPIGKMAERSYEIAYALSWSNIPATMIAIGVIAIALVLLACFNYMNVAVASVINRLKEIGIRKVIGGGRKEIIQQFLVENTVLCALALGIGTVSPPRLVAGFQFALSNTHSF